MALKVLVIDDSSFFRDFLQDQLANYDLEVLHAINGFDGHQKLRTTDNISLIIMDYYLSRKSCLEILEAKSVDPNNKSIPVILVTAAVAKDKILEVVQLGVKTILNKPIKIDSLLTAIAKYTNISLELDPTPCLIDAHLNDKILFVEVAQGFNREKINLIKYKIAELLKLHDMEIPRILVLMTGVEFREEDASKIEKLLEEINFCLLRPEHARILTTSESLLEYLKTRSQSPIEIAKDLPDAMSGLFGMEGLESLTAEQDHVRETFFSSQKDLINNESFQLNFESESTKNDLSYIDKKIRIAVVDDDFVIQAIIEKTFKEHDWEICKYNNGGEFIAALAKTSFDLVFLDLMMPGVNGYGVLQFLSTLPDAPPIIVLSSLSRTESIQKVMEFGIKTYMVKPVKPEGILKKTKEILLSSF